MRAQVLINGVTVQIGISTQLTGNRTNRDLGLALLVLTVDTVHAIRENGV